MKWIIASDIHGSEYYCKQLMEAFDREGADKMILLGDILYHGPRNDLPKGYNPKAVFELLNEKKECISCVRGNCDAEVDQMVLEFPIMADYSMLSTETYHIFITHGHLFNEENLPMMKNGDILLHGHTHVPKCVIHDTYIYMNPGSVSIPKDNTWHGYMVFDHGKFIWKDMSGNVKMQYPKREPLQRGRFNEVNAGQDDDHELIENVKNHIQKNF